MEVRLQKYLADCGVGSRRKCEQWIQEGLVSVDGEVITQLGTRVNPEKQQVSFNEIPVTMQQEKFYLALNKPVGYITSANDQFGRKTVLDLLPDVKERIFPVGRLDYHTSGILLLTNDGAFANKLTHPRYHIEKTYRACVAGAVGAYALKQLREGILLDNRSTAPARVKLLQKQADKSIVEITIKEGRNRQVRRMCDAVGHAVISLCRIRIGNIVLDSLDEGSYRPLTSTEVTDLLGLCYT